MKEVELLCTRCPCIRAHHRAKVSTTNRKSLTLCMALNHYELEQPRHSLERHRAAGDRLQWIWNFWIKIINTDFYGALLLTNLRTYVLYAGTVPERLPSMQSNMLDSEWKYPRHFCHQIVQPSVVLYFQYRYSTKLSKQSVNSKYAHENWLFKTQFIESLDLHSKCLHCLCY